jgi:hypothetical protein
MPSLDLKFKKKGSNETNKESIINKYDARTLMCLNIACGSLISIHATSSISINSIRLLIEDAIEAMQRFR